MNNSKVTLLFLFVFGLLIPMAFGMAGDLDKPSLSFSQNSTIRDKVMGVISSKEFKFLGGHFINADTTLEYAGDSAAVNTFLDRLAKCAGVHVHVSFSSDTDGLFSGEKTDADWTLNHNAWIDDSVFNVMVRTERIAKSAVRIPKAKSK